MAMNSTKIMLTMLVLMSTAFCFSVSIPTVDESHVDIQKDNSNEHSSFLPRNGRFLAQQVKAVRTCDVYPRLCRTADSPGPNCCNKQCVNLMTDKLNCGKCGKKCSYFEMCCQGECVKPSSDERHCGRCNKKCGKGNSCEYGLCSYA